MVYKGAPVLRTSRIILFKPSEFQMSSIGNKRRRTESGFVRVSNSKRPIDKSLINVVQSTGTAQLSTTLVTATFPCTITGLRWDADVVSSLVLSGGRWAIVIVRDGQAASTLALSNGSALYEPEQDVLAFGTWNAFASTGGGPTVQKVQGSTKSMRKLMGGDSIQFISLGDVASGAVIEGVLQFFCKV